MQGAALAVAALVLAAPKGTASRDQAANLAQASAALTDFRPEEALQILQEVKGKGPHNHADHVLLYEQLGIAYAYLEKNDEAQAAFRFMLALDPARAISYTLSPKVTFVFEEARKRAGERPAPSVDLSWPRDLKVDQPIPVDVDVVADPEDFLKRARLYFRVKGAPEFTSRNVVLRPAGGEGEHLELPPAAAGATSNQTLELYLVALDDDDDEVLLFGSSKRPRELALAYVPPDPWYGKWWIWAIAGTVVAVGAGAAVFATTREPGPTIDGTFQVLR